MVTMKMRRPYTTASIWSSGKVTCTGANSEDQVNFATIFTTKRLHNVFRLYKSSALVFQVSNKSHVHIERKIDRGYPT